MNYAQWGGHALLGRIAFDTLPAWERDLIKPDMSDAALAKPYIPAHVKSVGDKVGQMCAILDCIYYPECRPYAVLPDGRWIPHSPPDENCQSSTGSGKPRSPVQTIELTEWLMTRMVESAGRQDWEDAIRYGGALGHFLQEPFTPGHAVDNAIFHELFPDPDPRRHIRLHHAFDSASSLFEPTPPKLMGTTIAEAAFRLYLEIEHGIRAGQKLIPSLIQSVYDGRPKIVRQAILADQCRKAAFVTASAWHTAISIAMGKFDETETEALKYLNLTDIPPYFVHHWQYTDVLPGNLVQDGSRIPMHVWTESAAGKKQEELIEQGFGMGGHMGVKFFINRGIYPWLRLQVGLPSRQREGQTEHTSTTFYVDTDVEYNQVYSEDIDYQAHTAAQFRLQPDQPVQEILVNVSEARSLILRAKSDPFEDEKTGQISFSIPHVAICNPVLCKERP